MPVSHYEGQNIGVEAQFMQRTADSVRFLGEGCPVQLAALKLFTAKCNWMQMAFRFGLVSGGTDFLRETSEALRVCDLCVRRLGQCCHYSCRGCILLLLHQNCSPSHFGCVHKEDVWFGWVRIDQDGRLLKKISKEAECLVSGCIPFERQVFLCQT